MITADQVIHGRLVRQPGATAWEADARLHISDGQIRRIETRAPQSADSLLLLPALADAHDHGRGLRCTAYGATDQPLESWLPALYDVPRTDAYLNTVVSLCRLARSGVGSVVSCHPVQDSARLDEELRGAARAASDIGLRLALVVPLRDRNPLAYGADTDLLSLLAPGDRTGVKEIWGRRPLPPREQVERVRAAAASCDNTLVNVQLGPLGPQWVSDELFVLIAEESERTGRRMHMHLFETRYQREWADAAYPDGLLQHLDELGILCERLTVAHGVWLRPNEMELLAERGVTVSINSCSNLRLRSGLAPAREMLRHGVAIALGIDGFSVDDDDDVLRELRLFRWLHDGPGFDEGIPPARIFEAATSAGAFAVTGRRDIGTLEPGMAADLMALDCSAAAPDAIEGLCDPMEALMARVTRDHVRHLWVAGRTVVRDGRVAGVDEAAADAELIAAARADAGRVVANRPLAQRYQAALRRFYCEGLHRKATDRARMAPT